MAELDRLAELLRQQKKDLLESRQKTVSRSGETTELVDKIADLRRRSEETQRRFQAAADESRSKRPK